MMTDNTFVMLLRRDASNRIALLRMEIQSYNTCFKQLDDYVADLERIWQVPVLGGNGDINRRMMRCSALQNKIEQTRSRLWNLGEVCGCSIAAVLVMAQKVARIGLEANNLGFRSRARGILAELLSAVSKLPSAFPVAGAAAEVERFRIMLIEQDDNVKTGAMLRSLALLSEQIGK